MSLLRLIARLDVKGAHVVKGVQMEGLRIVGRPAELARRYAEAGADELLYIDTVASLYGRNALGPIIEEAVQGVFIPITVGGGLRGMEDVRAAFLAGADKVALNTAALRRPGLIDEVSGKYGSQALVVAVDAKRVGRGWEAYAEGGREPTGRPAVDWAFEAVQRGAGEVLITSIDRDGTRRGFDTALVAKIAPHVPVPVCACGGMGTLEHLKDVIRNGRADAVAMASCLHYGKITFLEMRKCL